ncbi:MAG: Bax inhibitor-1/YccA family protein [Actinomycetaceae bacterium]|nr:Bax inhibitor-1/YccA family protein [Actinomycetaceae bacterium]
MNPVMARIENDVEKTPNGYPQMPGYQPGAYGQSHSGASQPIYGQTGYAQPGYSQPTYDPYAAPGTQDMSQFEQTYAGRSADAVDRGQVTMDDIVVKTGILFALTVVGAAITWFITGVNPALGNLLMIIGAIGGFITAMVNIFKKQPSPALSMAYAVFEGMFLGGISAFFEAVVPGIVVQALMATLIVFAVTLTLYKMRVVRNTPALQRFTIIGLVSVFLFFIASFVYSMFSGVSLMSTTILGLPLGLIIGVVCIVLAITSLVTDFDVAETAVANGMPRVFAWYCAFGIMVTLIWLYINILRVLYYIAEMQR